MPNYKNTSGKLFWLDAGEDATKWLPECVEITDAEAEAIRASELVPPTYKELRAAEYPSLADQFDLLYHGGYDAWRSAVDVIKAKYPKPEGAS